MSRKRVEPLIKRSRRISDNEEFDNDPNNPLGIVDDEVVEYLQDAQDNVFARITEVHPKLFLEEEKIDIVAQQEKYSLPKDIYLGGRITHVEALFSNREGDYYTLPHRSLKARLGNFPSNFPGFYIRSGNNIILQPRPSAARTDGIRITYQKKLPDIDIRRGKVLSSTIVTDNVQDITIDLSPTLTRDVNLPLIAERTMENFDFITVVDSTGAIKMRDIPVDSYDSTTGVITVVAGFNRATGETITAGDYIVGGGHSTSHTQLPETCERYLVAYAAWKMLKRDSMVDSRDQAQELAAMLDEIVDSFREIDEDQVELELDEDWMI